MTFQKATKKRAKLRLAIIGPSGSGKTYTALTLATQLGQRVAVIDTERGSASKYADKFPFDVLELTTFSPLTYVDAIHEAEKAGYDVLVIDSLSHAWTGKEGALEQVDRAAKKQQSNNTFGAWRDVTPLHNAMVDAIVGASLHVIATMRAKTDYAQEKNEQGRTVIRKIGLAPVQRDGLEYEFDVVADMDNDNTFIVSKSRCEQLTGAVITKPNGNVAAALRAWLDEGAEPVELRKAQAQPPQQPPVKSNGHSQPPTDEPPPFDAEFDTLPTAQQERAAVSPVANADGYQPTCPVCDGAMWDNREGKRNPKAPDFKCKDKECNGAIWLPETPEKGRAAMFANVKAIYGDNTDEFKTWLQERYHVASSKELTLNQLAEVVARLKQQQPA